MRNFKSSIVKSLEAEKLGGTGAIETKYLQVRKVYGGEPSHDIIRLSNISFDSDRV